MEWHVKLHSNSNGRGGSSVGHDGCPSRNIGGRTFEKSSINSIWYLAGHVQIPGVHVARDNVTSEFYEDKVSLIRVEGQEIHIGADAIEYYIEARTFWNYVGEVNFVFEAPSVALA